MDPLRKSVLTLSSKLKSFARAVKVSSLVPLLTGVTSAIAYIVLLQLLELEVYWLQGRVLLSLLHIVI